MIHPSPTSKIDPSLARGVLEEVVPDSPTRPGYIVLSVPNTSYRLHLRPAAPVIAAVGGRLVGVIAATARRVDVVDTGGKYVEPLFGRPRRVQGKVVSLDEANRTIVVDAGGVTIHCGLSDARQRPGDFGIGDLVSFDVLDGASFEAR
ncbi:MAG: hypothetical protein K2Q20_06905 [Phycisphaerales bacterium]|nr:hypothetical protein [Phycisphaerales bacterium]